MVILFFLFAQQDKASVIKSLENYLSNNIEICQRIKQINNNKSIYDGILYWKKNKNDSAFSISYNPRQNDQRLLIISHKNKLLMHVTKLNSRDTFKPRDISDSPLSRIFEKKVCFADCDLQALLKPIDNLQYEVFLHYWSDPEMKKGFLKIRFSLVDNKQVYFIKWDLYVPSNNGLVQFQIQFKENVALSEEQKSALADPKVHCIPNFQN